jgi:hypothetical protein
MDSYLYPELEQAYLEGRQPLCPHCHEPLVVEQGFYKWVVWKWNSTACRYERSVPDAGAESPLCTACHGEFPVFANDKKLRHEMGLDY